MFMLRIASTTTRSEAKADEYDGVTTYHVNTREEAELVRDRLMAAPRDAMGLYWRVNTIVPVTATPVADIISAVRYAGR